MELLKTNPDRRKSGYPLKATLPLGEENEKAAKLDYITGTRGEFPVDYMAGWEGLFAYLGKIQHLVPLG